MKNRFFLNKKTRHFIGMSAKLALVGVLAVVLSGVLSIVPDKKTNAAPPYYGVQVSTSITNSAPNRNICSNNTPAVDFWAFISNPTFDENTGDITYRVNLRWRSCNDTNTRAYAIYDTGSRDVCPQSGFYGVGNSNAYDCVKYVGPNNPYNDGNELTCAGGSGSVCVTDQFKSIRVKQNQPPDALQSDFVPLDKKASGNWNAAKYSSGSRTFSGGLCQYYKTGNNWSTNHIGSRCMNIGITFSWVPNTPASIRPNADVSPKPVEPGQIVTATASISQVSGNMSATTKYRRYFWYQDDSTSGYDAATESVGAQVHDQTTAVAVPYTAPPWTKTVVEGKRFVCTYMQLYGQNSPTTLAGNPSPIQCAAIVRKPFLRASGDINTTCGGSAGTINTFWNGTNGSSTNLALYAGGAIPGTATNGLGFATATQRLSLPQRPKGLTFSNNGSAPYGQALGAQVGACTIEVPPSGSTGSVTLNGMPDPADLKDGVLYVDGNVTITDNIRYGNQDNQSFTFSDTPYFKVVASGDIYIASNVTRIDGTYIASGTYPGTTGTIYTCTSGGVKPTTLTPLPVGCGSSGSTLTVNGALQAKNIKYLRLNGSITSGIPGEVVNYDPLAWLDAATPSGQASITTSNYDAYTIMPPIL